MKGYRFITEEALRDLVSSKRIVNSRGEIHRYAANNLEKSKRVKCFWFFKTIEDALNSAPALFGVNADSVLAEFDIPDSAIYEQGRGSYGASGLFAEFCEDASVEEFTTLAIRREYLLQVHFVAVSWEVEQDYDEDVFYKVFSLVS